MQTKQLAVMFTDIKGFTDKSSQKTRDELRDLLDEHDKLVRPVFCRFGGRIVKTIGDAFLVVFESPTDAVLCGVAVQETLKKRNDAGMGEKLEVRVAINSGDVYLRGKDVFGEPVNIAARIEGIAEANEIYFTEAVYLAMNKREVPSAEIGYRRLKGIPEEIKVYKVIRERNLAGDAPENLAAKNKTTRVGRSWWVNVLFGVAIVAAILILKNAWLGVLLYLYFSYSLYVIAKKTNAARSWLSFIPVVNYFYLVNVAQKSLWWYLLFAIPGVNVAALVFIVMGIAEMRRHGRWLGLLSLVPGLNLFLPGYLAFVNRLDLSASATDLPNAPKV